jgi:hypothetical protein
MGQSGGRWLDSDIRQLHRRVRTLRGSWGSRQFSSTEHIYPSPRASTDLSATLSSHDLGCNEVFATTTTASDPMHSSSDGHPSGHVYSDTSSCRAQPGGVRYSALPRRGAHRRIPRWRVVAVSYDGENLLGDQPVPGPAPHDLEVQLHLACDDGEPRFFTEAERHAA